MHAAGADGGGVSAGGMPDHGPGVAEHARVKGSGGCEQVQVKGHPDTAEEPPIMIENCDATDDAAVVWASLEDPDRFEEIFRRHFTEIHRYVARRLGPDVADDLAAETFVIAFRRRAAFDPARGTLRPWLYGIATNLVGAHRRAEKRYHLALAKAPVDPAAEDHSDQVIRSQDSGRRRKELARGLAGLSSGDRDALLLVALAGFGYGEVAQALGIPEGTVASRLSRARRRLRAVLGPNADAEGVSPMSDGLDPIRSLLGDPAEPMTRTVAAAERRLNAERVTPTRPVRRGVVAPGGTAGRRRDGPGHGGRTAEFRQLQPAQQRAFKLARSCWPPRRGRPRPPTGGPGGHRSPPTPRVTCSLPPAPITSPSRRTGRMRAATSPSMARAASSCEGTVSSGPRGDWATITKSAAHLMSAIDVAKWRKEGSPPYAQCNLGVSGDYSPLGPLRARLSAQDYPVLDGQPISAGQLAHLPTDPNALKNWLHKFVVDHTDPANGALNWVNDPYQSENFLFEQARDLLFLDPASPDVRAATLKMLAKLPMVRSAGEVTDPLGRPGVSLRLPPPPDTASEIDNLPTMQWIINPRTGTLLAAETIEKNGQLDQWTAVRQSGWTT